LRARRLPLAVTLAVLGLLGAAAFLLHNAPEAGAVEGTAPGLEPSDLPDPMILPGPEVAEARSLTREPAVEMSEVAPEPPRDESASAELAGLELLVEELEEIENRRPLDFHHGATQALMPWLGREGVPALIDECCRILDERALTSRVRGSLLALLGAWGGQREWFTRCDATGETWRSAVLGAGCSTSRAGVGLGTELDLDTVLPLLVPVEGRVLLLDPTRLPDPELQAVLMERADRLADDLEPWLSRVVAVLALGPALDDRPEILELFSRMLFDTSPWGLQVRVPVCYAMSQARGDRVRETLMQFLADDQVGPHGKYLARWWMGDTLALPHELEVLAAPLRDDASPHLDKMGAVGGLMKQVGSGNGHALEAIEEILTRSLGEEEDRTVRLALVVALADLRGGDRKLETLTRVLRSDEHATARLWAAKGLGGFEGALAVQARAVLELALVTESSGSVLRAIQASLGRLS
jgi:hypothetical protein